MRFGMMGMAVMLTAASTGMAHGGLDNGSAQSVPDYSLQAGSVAAKNNSVEGTIGVCRPVVNKGLVTQADIDRGTYALSTVDFAAGLYTHDPGQDPSVGLDFETSEVTVLEQPKHGQLKQIPYRDWAYYPDSTYLGSDRAVFLVRQGDHQIKVVYFFKVVQGTNNSAWDSAYKKFCSPPGWWRISTAGK